jgi:hypothetical protein
MTNAIKRRRVAFAGLLAAAALGTAAPTPADAHKYRCEGAVERLEAKFRQIEERNGYDKAVRWWENAWRKYHDRCVV